MGMPTLAGLPIPQEQSLTRPTGFPLHRDQERMEEVDKNLDISENLCEEETVQ